MAQKNLVRMHAKMCVKKKFMNFEFEKKKNYPRLDFKNRIINVFRDFGIN